MAETKKKRGPGIRKKAEKSGSKEESQGNRV